MQVYLCEKPSQGRDIARVVGADLQQEGYMEGNGKAVTWAIGHLLEAAPPEAYDPALVRWKLDTLPILPTTWRVGVKPKLVEQYRVIRKLLAGATEVVIATDADREGEMIARELLKHCEYQGPVRRLWLSALDDASIKKALITMKDGQSTCPLYYAALARSQADWLVGMNLTRLFTVLARENGFDGLLSVGRVQTPTLKLVVDRDRQIEQFVPQPYFTVTAKLTFDGKMFQAQWVPPVEAADGEGRCCNESVAIAAQSVLLRQGKAIVKEIKVKTVTEAPPLPFELSQLQSVCSAKFGLGAQETLDIAQALYEKHKTTTYPRTDCSYLPTSMFSGSLSLVRSLVGVNARAARALKFIDLNRTSRAWNDEKVAASAHHAIIPIGTKLDLEHLTEKERQVYELIRDRYLAQFMDDYVYETIEVTFVCGQEVLRTTGRITQKQGWKAFVDECSKKTVEAYLPSLQKSDLCIIIDAKVAAKQTEPPVHYTEGTLITAMKNIARYVTDPKLKETLSATSGIGTNATRGGIIKELIDRGLLMKQKPHILVASEKGKALIDAVPADISDPGTTAKWEQDMELIAKGELEADDFISERKTWVADLVKHHQEHKLTIINQSAPRCPQCNKPMVRRKSKITSFWGCSQYPKCDGVVFDVNGKPIPRKVLTRGVIRRSGKSFSG